MKISIGIQGADSAGVHFVSIAIPSPSFFSPRTSLWRFVVANKYFRPLVLRKSVADRGSVLGQEGSLVRLLCGSPTTVTNQKN